MLACGDGARECVSDDPGISVEENAWRQGNGESSGRLVRSTNMYYLHRSGFEVVLRMKGVHATLVAGLSIALFLQWVLARMCLVARFLYCNVQFSSMCPLLPFFVYFVRT